MNKNKEIFMPSFLVNYGGPSSQLSTNNNSFSGIFTECEKFYHAQVKSTVFSVHGLDVTYYRVGIHRMAKVELPDQVLEDMKSKDTDVRKKAIETKNYSIRLNQAPVISIPKIISY